MCCYATQKTQPKSSHCFSEFSCSLMQGFCVSEPVPPAPGASCVFECKYSFLVCHVIPVGRFTVMPGSSGSVRNADQNCRGCMGFLPHTVVRTESEELPTCTWRAAVLGQALAVLLLWNFQDTSCGLPLPRGASAGRTCHDCCAFALCFLSI